jgi:carbon storage regulator CsrA
MPLTLSRREDEALILETSDGPIEVWVDKIRQGSVKLSIYAPEVVRVLRDELVEEVE